MCSFLPSLNSQIAYANKRHAFFWSSYSHQSCQMLRSAPWSTTCSHISAAWYIIDLHVQMISNDRTNNHSHCTIMGLSWLETMKVNLLAGGEDTAAPLTLFQDHPRLSSRTPHAASTQRKTFNWVINYTTNKTPSWFLPPLVFLLLFEAAFRVFSTSMVVACSCAVEGCAVMPESLFLFCLLNFIDGTLPETCFSWTASRLCRVHFSPYGSLHTWEGKPQAVT